MITDSSFVQYKSCLFDVSPCISPFLRYQSSLDVSPYHSTFPSLVLLLSYQWFLVRQFVYTVLVLSSQSFSARQFVFAVLVLPSQRFSPSLVHLYSLDQSYLLNISRYVNSFVQHQYSQKLFSFISSFVQLLYQSYHSSQRFSVRYFVFTVLVLSSQRFSVRQLVCAVLVLSSQRFSVRQLVCTVISLISMFLRALDRLYSLGTLVRL